MSGHRILRINGQVSGRHNNENYIFSGPRAAHSRTSELVPAVTITWGIRIRGRICRIPAKISLIEASWPPSGSGFLGTPGRPRIRTFATLQQVVHLLGRPEISVDEFNEGPPPTGTGA